MLFSYKKEQKSAGLCSLGIFWAVLGPTRNHRPRNIGSPSGC
jgi:hypothetical protein